LHVKPLFFPLEEENKSNVQWEVTFETFTKIDGDEKCESIIKMEIFDAIAICNGYRIT
jgi:hypothetical protein